MQKPRAVKINPHGVEPIHMSQRTNFKLVDPATVGSQNLTFGMVVIEPHGIAEPGHAHDDQEEIFFCLTGNGIVIADDERREIPIGPKDAVFFPKKVWHGIRNPNNTPLEVLWIMSPAGWVFDKDPALRDKAMRGVAE
jgi:mannose-6-phosphate isomerase-like protein (cupin superfamily)